MTPIQWVTDVRKLMARLVHAPRPIPPAKPVLLPADTTKVRRVPGISPPVVVWPDKAGTETFRLTCPNCGSDVPKPLLLTIDFTTAPGWRWETNVLRCTKCTSRFYVEQLPLDYGEDAMLQLGRVPFYLQQGAGISLITRPLAQLRNPAGSVYAEIGCGFGFGLDYAHHAKHWIGRGIDPGGISALGQEMLGVSIDRRYLADSESALEGTCDVVMSSETIEHVASPASFVRVLRSMLRPGGTLILTTPDGDDLRTETPPGALIGLLSPGLHYIFQTETSLRQALADAGFAHIVVKKDGYSLVACASDQPVELEPANTVMRAEYRAYLEQRAADFPSKHEMCLAFAGRALQEAVNDGAFDQARRVHTLVKRACRVRFKRSLDALGERIGDHKGLSLENLANRMPLSLGGLLYSDAILRLASGESRASLGRRFLQAAAAAELLQTALADLALGDGMSEEIAWTGRAEAVLCAAAAGVSDIVEQLSALPPAPDVGAGAARREIIVERTLVELVNGGHYELARKLSEVKSFDTCTWADPNVSAPRSDSHRDALFCLAVLDSQSDEISVIIRGRDRFNRVKQMLKTPDGHGGPNGLFAAAVRGEVAARERLATQDGAATSGTPSQHVNG